MVFGIDVMEEFEDKKESSLESLQGRESFPSSWGMALLEESREKESASLKQLEERVR